ncbi:MAG: radical SAM protein [Chloroflexi bacterium]|nr:radical SAM protein [Chloroflexota bacterium]
MPIHATHPRTDETITANLTATAIVLSPRFGTSYSFDRAGRLLSLFVDDRSYQRTLDNRIIFRGGQGTDPNGQSDHTRRELPSADGARLVGRVFEDVRALADVVPDLALVPAHRDRLRDALALVLDFGPGRLAEDAAVYRSLYSPVSILPPDQYLALVLQATQGCSWNRCTFCGLYRDRPFRIFSPDQFEAHCAGVRDFFGAGLSLRRGIFLADANALIIPQPRLLALLEIAQRYFGEQALSSQPGQPRPVYSFVSAFDVERKSAAEWAALHALGLQRAYIGLETGDNALLRFLNKPGEADHAIDAVHALRAGGVAVGVIIMAGIGGDQYAATHVEGSVAAVQAMDLGPDDLVYLSRYVPMPGTEYDYQATVAGIRPLNEDETVAQLQTLQTRLRAAAPRTRVTLYRVENFAL